MEDNNFYEEMVNEKDFKETKNLGPIFVVLFIIIILGFGIYVTYLKLTEKPKEKEKVENVQEEVVQTFELVCDNTCDYNLNIKGEEIKVNYTVSNDLDTHMITINNKEIVNKTFACGGPATLKVLDDIILISYHDGCDIGGNTLFAYTKEGNELFSYEYLDNMTNMWIESTDFDVENNKIKINGTRLYHGNTLRLSNTQEVNICEQNEWPIYMIDENTITSGVYEIEYSGNNSFTSPILKESKTVKELLTSCEVNE